MDMIFKNPVFHQGWNVTVRRGKKWALHLHAGDRITLRDSDPEKVCKWVATIIGVLHVPFFLIPNCFVNLEHDPTCRTLGGLLSEMERVYEGFTLDEMVTVVIFHV